MPLYSHVPHHMPMLMLRSIDFVRLIVCRQLMPPFYDVAAVTMMLFTGPTTASIPAAFAISTILGFAGGPLYPVHGILKCAFRRHHHSLLPCV